MSNLSSVGSKTSLNSTPTCNERPRRRLIFSRMHCKERIPGRRGERRGGEGGREEERGEGGRGGEGGGEKGRGEREEERKGEGRGGGRRIGLQFVYYQKNI